jgi:hypothetical protein
MGHTRSTWRKSDYLTFVGNGLEWAAAAAPKTVLPSAVAGIYDWTWNGITPQAPADINVGIAFSGWAEVENGLFESNAIVATLPGDKYFSIGGGNENGALTGNETCLEVSRSVQ